MATTISDSDILLDPPQTADMLGLTKATLDAWRSRGILDLPYVKVGSRVRYRLEDVREYIRRQTVSAQ